MRKAAFIGNETLWAGGHPAGHPLRPERLQYTWEMLNAYNAFALPHIQVAAPRMVTENELATFHTPAYINAVRRLSAGESGVDTRRFNFGAGDNPVFKGMYESEGLKVGAALVGAELLLNNEAEAVFSYAGGLHHAGANHASGFCVFGDGAIAIKQMLEAGWRIAYIDIDAHHGDGVQAAFYDDPRVLTISFHESGHYLFPGTGFTHEIGAGAGLGYSVNIPFLPYTGDETFLWTFEALVPPLLERFAPDVVVSQFGVDAHWRDPLTHLALTTPCFELLFKRIYELSPRLLAVGGGGYDISVVPRIWTLAWGALSEQTFANALPQPVAADYTPPSLHDTEIPVVPEKHKQITRYEAEKIVATLKENVNLFDN